MVSVTRYEPGFTHNLELIMLTDIRLCNSIIFRLIRGFSLTEQRKVKMKYYEILMSEKSDEHLRFKGP